MAESLFIKVDEVGELLGISRAEAYRIIKKLNLIDILITLFLSENIQYMICCAHHIITLTDVKMIFYVF